MARSPTWSGALITWWNWASIRCTCLRSIPSAASAAKVATTPRSARATTSGARGRSARRRAAIRPSTPSSARSRSFGGWSAAARARGLDLALDIAFQVAPDHPYVSEHPEWFRQRPDGTVQYAENPPKKYQDIYPFDFETSDWKALWEELESIFQFWIEQGVRTFRVDNPHTKSFHFWEWCIDRIKRRHPDVVFLSEAFTRPRPMYRLAKLGFTQSYTYFAWRTAKWELMQYMEELTRTEVAEFFRPNFWPNTPDILTAELQSGSRPVFLSRLTLAATLAANYGIYGPAFELMEHVPREPGSEEYRDSEKYQLREWDLDRPDSLRHFIARVNQIRRANPALHSNDSLQFHRIDNEQLLVYSKHTAREDDEPGGVATSHGLASHGAIAVWEEHPAAPRQPHSGGGQSRSPPHTVRVGRAAARRLGHRSDAVVRCSRSARRCQVHLAWRLELHRAEPTRGSRRIYSASRCRTDPHRAREPMERIPRMESSKAEPGPSRIRCGTRTPSSTSCTCAPSWTVRTMEWATSAG
jgi:hypothetical protein